MYTAFILLGLGFFLNWLIGGTWLVATGLVIATRMPGEEAMMAEQLGGIARITKLKQGVFCPNCEILVFYHREH
jgi:hypothetical protein